MHIPERAKCNWIRERIETIDPVRTGAAAATVVEHNAEALRCMRLPAARCRLRPSREVPPFTRPPARPHCFLPSPPIGAQPQYTKREKLNILDRLAWSEMFETFLAKKWVGCVRACVRVHCGSPRGTMTMTACFSCPWRWNSLRLASSLRLRHTKCSGFRQFMYPHRLIICVGT